MKEDLIKISTKLKETNNKRNSIKDHINSYYKAKNGFMSSYSICSLFIFSLSFGSIILCNLLPSYIVGYLTLLINTISVSFLIYLISENKDNLKVMEKNNINNLKLELKKYDEKFNSYENEYKKIIETVMLGDDIMGS